MKPFFIFLVSLLYVSQTYAAFSISEIKFEDDTVEVIQFIRCSDGIHYHLENSGPSCSTDPIWGESDDFIVGSRIYNSDNLIVYISKNVPHQNNTDLVTITFNNVTSAEQMFLLEQTKKCLNQFKLELVPNVEIYSTLNLLFCGKRR